MISTLVLDLDGPLLEGRERHYRCYSDILRAHGHEPVAADRYWAMKRSRVSRRELLALSGAAALYDTFLADWLRLIETREYLQFDRLQDGIPGILADWKAEGRRLLLATLRNNRANLDWQLDSLGIARHFDAIVAVAGATAAADKAAGIAPLLNAGGLHDVLWVGDTEVDVVAARQLGVPVCAVTCGLRTGDYLAGLSPDMVEPDLPGLRRTLAAAGR